MMYSIDELTLISGIDIPISELQVNVHQPTIREIAYIGERNFYQSASLITVDKEELMLKDNMTDEDKVYLSQQSNFQILMSMIGSSPIHAVNLQILFTLLFPKHMVELEERFIMLVERDNQKITMIDENNFSVLQDVIKTILCLNGAKGEQEFNPAGDKAREIAEKIKKGRAKVARLKGENQEEQSGILSRYISSLTIGSNTLALKDMLDLTLYQLFDLLERYGLYTSYGMSIQAKMAGAKDVEDVDWLKNIH